MFHCIKNNFSDKSVPLYFVNEIFGIGAKYYSNGVNHFQIGFMNNPYFYAPMQYIPHGNQPVNPMMYNPQQFQNFYPKPNMFNQK